MGHLDSIDPGILQSAAILAEAFDSRSWLEKLRDFKHYSPKDEHMTSEEEVSMIEKYFRIPMMTTDMQRNFRDMTVLFYTNLINSTNTSDPLFMHYFRAMQSITTVIDKNIYK